MALDPASAQLVSNYTVVDWQIVGLIGQKITVKSATYNAATHAVTLAFTQRLLLRKTSTLTINGTTPSGVKNVSGLLLDGANTGKPGSNFVTTISQYNLAGPASQRPVAAVRRAKEVSHTRASDVRALRSERVAGQPAPFSHRDSPGLGDAAC